MRKSLNTFDFIVPDEHMKEHEEHEEFTCPRCGSKIIEIEDDEVTERIAACLMDSLYDIKIPDLTFGQVLTGLLKCFQYEISIFLDGQNVDVDGFMDGATEEGIMILDNYIKKNQNQIDPLFTACAFAMNSEMLINIFDRCVKDRMESEKE